MKKLFFAVCVLVFGIVSSQAYFTSCRYMPLARSSWDYVDRMPVCTLNVTLKQFGADAYMDVTFDAKIDRYSYSDSLEIVSQLVLPKNTYVDSMMLWIGTFQQPAYHISVSQANATYDNIVHVTRRDPAYLRKNSVYNSDSYELKVFPVYRDSARHVRMFLKFMPQGLDSLNKIDLGNYTSGAVRIRMDKNTEEIPRVDKGTLTRIQTASGPVYSLSNPSYAFVSWGENTRKLACGAEAIIDTTFADTNYFNLSIDFQKLFSIDTSSQPKHITFVWVPSTYYNYYRYTYYYGSYFEVEKTALQTYISTFASQDLVNIVYAGENALMCEPHMIPASANGKTRMYNFLQSRSNPSSAVGGQTFAALKMAFSSIASCDTPAVIFCMDRDPASAYSSQNLNLMDQQVNQLVAINVNKARFIAWINSSKYLFYQKLAAALNGKISTLDSWNITTLDNEFRPSISKPEVFFDNTNADVMDMVDRNVSTVNYNTPWTWDYSLSGKTGSQKQGLLWDYFGKSLKKDLSFAASVDINGGKSLKIFAIRAKGNRENGCYTHKGWANELVNQIALQSNVTIAKPTEGLSGLSGSSWGDKDVYSRLVGISKRNGVLTHATALLALEPGMVLSPDPLDPNNGSGPISTAIEDDSNLIKAKGDSLKLTASPNPFNPNTRILLSGKGIVSGQELVLTVYDIQGRVVNRLHEKAQMNYAHFSWNGRDVSGRLMGSGIYVARIKTQNKLLELKLFLTK